MQRAWPWLLSSVVASLAAGGHRAPSNNAMGRLAMVNHSENGRQVALSVGSPSEGHLVGGMTLEPSRYIHIVPAYATSGARWGLPGLVDLLEHAARRVAHAFPGTALSVGDLSRKGGGDIDRHRSHESGRDADVAFFVSTAAGKPLVPQRFVSFDARGLARAWPGAHFDDARNWTFVAALLEDAAVRVTHIFVSTPLRARLLRYAERIGAPLDLRERAALVLMQPHGVPPHDDHFHVRIGCPPRQAGECVELPERYRHPVRSVLVARPRNRFGRRAGAPPSARSRLPARELDRDGPP